MPRSHSARIMHLFLFVLADMTVCQCRLTFLLLAAFSTIVHAEPATVIVLSWDGVRHDYPDLRHYPGLDRMIKQGARADRLTPVYPSNTFPGHASLATGTYPDVHGIVGNGFIDSKRGKFSYSKEANWIMAEPLWIAAERQGVIAAVYFWAGSETPWRGQQATWLEAPFDGKRATSAKVDQLLDWLDLPLVERPRLIMSYWAGSDRMGHRQGPDHPDIAERIAHQDQQLQRIIARLDERKAWRHTTLIVVSDHGMTEVNRPINLKRLLQKDNKLDVEIIKSSAIAHIYTQDEHTKERAFKVLSYLPNLQAHYRQNFDRSMRMLYPERSGDIIVTTQPPYTFVALSLAQKAGMAVMATIQGWKMGMHGYDPKHPDMGGIFIAMGRNVCVGCRLQAAHQIDLAPTVARLLGIEPPRQSEGKALLFSPFAQ